MNPNLPTVGGALPSRFKVLNWGANESVSGTFFVGAHTAKVLVRNQRARGFERVAIDFNHSTVPGAPDHRPGMPPPIFGYGAPVVRPGEGIYLEDVTWTPLGEKHARNFEDVSPAISPGEPGTEVEFLHSVALTANGAIHGLTFGLNRATVGTADVAVLTEPNQKPLTGLARAIAAHRREAIFTQIR